RSTNTYAATHSAVTAETSAPCRRTSCFTCFIESSTTSTLSPTGTLRAPRRWLRVPNAGDRGIHRPDAAALGCVRENLLHSAAPGRGETPERGAQRTCGRGRPPRLAA